MIALRQMAVAFLFYDKQMLFMEKSSDKSFLYGMAIPVGGHLDQHEISKPEEACLREIQEETGLTSEDLSELRLKYIILRIKDTEIRIQYVYFANVNHQKVKDSEEGRLFWTKCSEVANLNVTATTKCILEHYMSFEEDTSDIYVGTMKSNAGDPEITWAILEDWENKSLLSNTL